MGFFSFPSTAKGIKVMGENLTTRQAAEVLQIKETTMEQWRWQGRGPRFIKLGRCVRYRKIDIDAFIDARVFSSTTEAEAAA